MSGAFTTGLRNTGWALYGASAWVWCIGMFLPVLLLQWYGWSGFLIVSIPNVLGAMGVGLLLARRQSSEAFCTRHAGMMRFFIIATITFHTLFLAIVGRWLLPESAGLPFTNFLVLPACAWMVAWLLAMLPRAAWPWLGTLVWLSAVALLWHRWDHGMDNLSWSGDRPGVNVLWYAPIFCLGFLLCPWLDGPFHRALQATDSRWTFLLLGPAFLLMLFVTASYWTLRPDTLLIPVFAHLVTQAVFTMAANIREVSAEGVVGGKAGFMLLVPLLGPLLPWIGSALAEVSWQGSLDAYLRYMSLYALVFPALVLYFCTPRPWPKSAGRLTAFTLLMLVSLAMGEAGLIQLDTWGHPAWTAGAVALVLGVRWMWPGPRPVSC